MYLCLPMSVLFLSRHYPPNSNINGESICDMVEYLETNYGVQSHIICIDRTADGGANTRRPAGTVYRIKSLYTGKNPLLRFVAFLYDGYMLAQKAKQFDGNFVICTTSPPLLPMWAGLLWSKRVNWALWTFDLFPEGFHVTRFIGKNNPLYRLAHWATYHNSPDLLLALGKRQAAFVQKAYGREIPTLVLPCGVFFEKKEWEIPPDWHDPVYTWFGYCGNVGDPHNPEFIKAAIDHIDPIRQRLVLALYGNRAAELKAYAQGKPGVVLVNRVPREQLHFIDVHLVTLRAEWTHIAVPSKAVSAVFMGGSILFCGNHDSDNWHMLQDAGWLIEENQQLAVQVQSFLQNIDTEEVAQKRAAAPAISEQLRAHVLAAYRDIAGRSGQLFFDRTA